MKSLIKNLSIILLSVIVILACKDEKEKEETGETTPEVAEKVKQSQDVPSSTKEVSIDVDEIQEHIKTLKATEPIDMEILKEWLPEELGDFGRTKFSLGKRGYQRVSAVTATYTNGLKDKVKQTISIDLMDAAGESGSILASTTLLAENVVYETENEREHVKQVQHNGINARQTFNKRAENTILKFVHDNRYVIRIKSTRLYPEETWESVENFNFDKLPSELNQ